MERVRCIFCDRAPTKPYKCENGYSAEQCTGCGLVFVNPRPSVSEMKALYEGQETKIDLFEHIARRHQKTIEARRSLRTLKRLQPDGRLLEVGSAAGYFLWEARRQGYRVQGLDLTAQLVHFARDVLDVPTFEGTLCEAPFAPESFDIIYMRNVLSHLAYPRQEFATLNRLLRPGGLFVLETGNVAELPADQAGELELPDHLFHFSEATIAKLLELTGFERIEIRRFALLSSLPAARWCRNRIAAMIGNARRSGRSPALHDGRTLTYRLPRVRPDRWIRAHLSQLIRYDLGRMLPSQGRRCTLLVTARRA